jgi:hypothetical protein
MRHLKRFNESNNNDEFILNEMETYLEGVKSKMYNYIDNYFSQEEAQKHSENLMQIVSGYESEIATIKMKLLKNTTSTESKSDFPEFGTKEFNDIASKYFGGNPNR